MKTGSQLVIAALREAGVDLAFGLHGAHIDSLFQAALDDGLRIIDTRSEAGAGHAAEGYARAANRLGVAFVTAGGGFTNVLTSMANAFMDRTPVLYVAGSGRLDESETNTLQAGIDQVAMAASVSKWAFRVTRADQIPRLVAQAIRIARAAPRGPVLLDIPWDVLLAPVDEPAPPFATQVAPSGLSSGQAARICDLLRGSVRPIIVAGSEIVRGGGKAALEAFVRRTGIPVFADFEGLGLLSGIERENAGLVQGLASFADHGCAPDAVLLMARFGLNTGHGSGRLIPHEAMVVQVDSDARELGRLQAVTMGIVADPAALLGELAVAAEDAAWPDRAGWRDRAMSIVRDRQAHVRREATAASDRLHPAAACAVLTAWLPADSVVVADGALTYLWLSEWIASARPRAFLCHGYFGSMGVGMGVALGAQAALPPAGGRVVLVTGDGALGYSLAEFDAMARAGLPVIVVVMNNASWGATQHFQEMVMGPNRVTGTPLARRDYQDAARALGAGGHVCDTVEDLRAALDAALADTRPVCINVQVDLAPVPPEEKVLMGQKPF